MKAAVQKRLTELAAQRGGLSVRDIINEARRKDSPIHGEFEWDKAKAHAIYLENRARQLIRDWYVTKSIGVEEVVRVRRMVSLAVPGAPPSRRYHMLESVLTDEVQTAAMLQDALRELSSFKRKYRHLSALSDVMQAIDDVTDRRARKSDEGGAAAAT
jgi:Ran GTPase-activating protein (RanGAP) involved in mRNA processing and transport